MQLSWPRVYLSDEDAARDLSRDHARDLALQVLESAGFGSSAAHSSCEGSVSAAGGASAASGVAASGTAASGTAASGTAASATVFTVEADYSLTDNSEIRREILNDKWRQVFDKFDPEGFGEIPWDDLDYALRSSEMCSVVPPHKRDLLAQRAATHREQTTAITFQDFVNLMSGKRSRSFKCAVHQRDREVTSERDFHVAPRSPTPLKKMVRIIADEFLTEERDRKYYADQYTCCPPPLFILCITLIELGFFTYSVAMGEVNSSSPVPIDSVFIYRPDKRLQVWRFLFYMVLHAGMPPALVASITLLFLSAATFSGVEACSSRATPKPRTTTPTPRPNVTFHTYACPPAYATYYCLNGATCFTFKIAESLMYSCECSDGYMGNRCEFKDLDGSYLPTSLRQRVVLERASVASEASIVVILVVIVCMAAYMHCHRRHRGPKLAKRPPPPPLTTPAPATEPDSKLDSSVYLVPWSTMSDTRWLPLRPAPSQPPLPPLAGLPVGLGQDLKKSPVSAPVSIVPVNRVIAYPGRGHYVLPPRQC